MTDDDHGNGHDHPGDHRRGHSAGDGAAHSAGTVMPTERPWPGQGEAAKRPLSIALGLSLLTFVVQLVVGLWSQSLSLLTDSAHVLTDGVGHLPRPRRGHDRVASRPVPSARSASTGSRSSPPSPTPCSCWRSRRGRSSRPSDGSPIPRTCRALPVLVVGAFGLATNVIALRLLSGGGSLAAEGARLEVLADTIGSIGVVVGGAVIIITEATVIDAWVGLADRGVDRSRARSAWRPMRSGSWCRPRPPTSTSSSVTAELIAIPDVVDVHDLHVWTLTSDMEVLTAHVMVGVGADTHAVLDRARSVLSENHGIHHATLQVEPEDHTGCAEVDW